jgi:predicted glutamine amidotransferase
MCRFLLIRANTVFQPKDILGKFAESAAASRAPDGDWQGDGWGVSWLNDGEEWITHKSLKPIWEDTLIFSEIPKSRVVVAHARSASFPGQKNILEYNQPFVAGRYAFVFNGLLKSVSLSSPVDGKIGSQKIWSLALDFLRRREPAAAMSDLVQTLESHARAILALNLGLLEKKRFFVYCRQAEGGAYYQLHVSREGSRTMVCSEILDGFPFQPLPRNCVLEI